MNGPDRTPARDRSLVPGAKVRVMGEEGRAEGTVVRVLYDYGVLTVLIEKPAKVERMYRFSEVEPL